MDTAQRERFGAATGAIAAILILASVVFGIDEPPGFDDSAEQVADFVADNHGALQATTALTVLAGALFVWFLGSLTLALREAERPGPARLATVALAGGVLAITFGGIGTGLQWAASLHELDAPAVQALWDSGVIAFGFSAGIGFAVLVAASSVVALTSGGLPRALGWYGLVLALFTIVVATVGTFSETGAFSLSDGFLGFLAFFGFLVWLFVTSVVLVRAQPRPATGVPGPPEH